MNPHDNFDTLDQRFGGIARLYGRTALRRLRNARVCIIGICCVGSWAVAALARSGLGALTLVSLDDICVSNVNRQLHAMDGEFGRLKIEVMAARVQAINPECRVQTLQTFFNDSSKDQVLAGPFDYLFD